MDKPPTRTLAHSFNKMWGYFSTLLAVAATSRMCGFWNRFTAGLNRGQVYFTQRSLQATMTDTNLTFPASVKPDPIATYDV